MTEYVHTQEEPLFSFVVATDTHVMLEEGDESSAYPSSIKEFNNRSRYLVQEINRLSPDFVIHLGDFVQPVPSLPTYEPAVQIAKEIFAELKPKMYLTAGNHDIGDKKASWMPGPKIDIHATKLFEKYWGKSFSSFDHQGVHFVMVNTPVINSNLEMENEQREWLEKDLEENKNKRIFMFTHYPLYLRYPDEDEHYDNIAEPGRSWLLSLIEKYNVETLYAGHVHNYFYNEYANSKQYVLPALSFVRPDYNELYQIECGPEGGRNDLYKFAFFYVKVYKDKVVNQLIRTFGRLLDKDETKEAEKDVIESYHSLERRDAPIGVYLRHAWAENHFIPFANLDEFNRKVVRNDYPLLALWDLGIKKIRIPVGDYYLPDTLERIRTLKAQGHMFTAFSTGIPTNRIMNTLKNNKDLIDHWEVSVAQGEMQELAHYFKEIKDETQIMTFLSNIETSADQQKGTKFHHFIRHGFNTEDGKMLKQLHEAGVFRWVDGLVFNMTPEQSPFEVTKHVKEMADQYHLKASLHVQMRGADTPAYEHRDDLSISNRIAEVVVSTVLSKEVEIVLDTFMDHDRGYFIRNGLIDRKSNPRLQYYVFKYLSGVFDQFADGEVTDIAEYDDYKQINIQEGTQKLHLLLPKKDVIVNTVNSYSALGEKGTAQLVNLENGVIDYMDWTVDHGGQVILSKSLKFSSPVLLVLNGKQLALEGSKSNYVEVK